MRVPNMPLQNAELAPALLAVNSNKANPRAEAGIFISLDDPRVIDFLQLGTATATGMNVSVEKALKNTSMFRAVSLISGSMGMLPLVLIEKGTKKRAASHPLHRVLHRRPNDAQTAFDFRVLMQLRALVKGNGYAQIVRSRDVRTGKDKIVRLIPLDPDRTCGQLAADWTVSYRYQPKGGGERKLPGRDVFHLRGMSLDGLNGLSLVKQAAEAVALALSAELAAGRLFKNGTFVAGALTHPNKLSDPAFARLQASLAEKEGAENAGKNLILEEGMKYEVYSSTARNAQLIELRKLQVEEIARVTGVPRPLLMVDETSWGSGIEALGRFFVQYALGPWFEAWQQSGERSLLDDDENELFEIKFNPGALLRGSMKDQADFFAKALGSGGAPGWMSQNEARDLSDLPSVDGGDDVSKGSMLGHNGGPPLD